MLLWAISRPRCSSAGTLEFHLSETPWELLAIQALGVGKQLFLLLACLGTL
jgi:hypothetical protein